ncbi:MAG TPA: hypothetical protein VM120_03110 [Bryobacteraceae bacterium]|nr:hypothetical protein [Bryobacteraceae bacterium]
MTLQIAIPALLLAATGHAQSWMQWGRNAQHTGTVSVAGQIPSRILAERIYDPFSKAAQAESGGSLVNHYMAPLTDGRDAYMAFKTGRYVSCDPPGSQRPAPCGPAAWNEQIMEHQKPALGE